MTDSGLAAFYRRYNACCNEHRFEDLREFVARDVVINGVDRGLDTYADGLRAVIRAFRRHPGVRLLPRRRRPDRRGVGHGRRPARP
jgi:predicted ester cyclase